LFAGLEAASIVGIVKFNNTGDEIKQQSEEFADAHYSEDRNRDFLNSLEAYGVSNPRYGSIEPVEQIIYEGNYSSDTSAGGLTASEKFMSDVNANKYFYWHKLI